jgi:hypothetical protein
MRELLRLLGSTVSPASRALLPALFLMVAAPLALPLNATAGDPACSDGLDNDGDGLVDVGEDPGCADAADESERSAGLVCDDGEDNDGDGRADFPGDTGCSEPLDSSEVSDQDTDGVVDVLDNCPFASNPDQTDSDGNQIGDPCECGDQNGDATVNVLDILAINDAIFNPALVTDLCDTNHDNRCNVLDLIGANNKIFGAPAYCSRYPGPSGPLSSPPSVSNLRLSETSFPLPQTGQRFPLTVELDFSDPDRDLVQLILTLTGPQGPLFRFLDEFKSVEVAGSASRSISIDSSFPAGNYTVSAQLVDSVESESNVESTGFIVDASVPAPIAITDVSPPSGQAGDTVTLTGSGFTSVSEEALRISFLRGQRSAELVSVLADELQVIVPDGAITGPILLESPIGITQSAVPFSVVATISVFPETYELLRGESVDLACTLSGTPTSIADWSIASGSDPALGSVDESGVYAAPADLPPTNPVVVRCASRDDPQLFADAAVTVLPPAPMPGQATILAQAGGEVFTADREVTASIPPGSLAQDADLAIDIPAAATLPPVTDNTVHVASAQLDPPGVDFAVPASVSFSLRHWVQPGTALTVTDLAGAPAPSPGSPVAAAVVGTAIVDASGRLAVAELDQTGAYAVDADLAIAKSTAAGLLETLIGSTGWRLSRPRDTELLEGLTVPVLIEPIDGNPGQGIGPFFEGVEVEATLDGVPPQDNPLRAGPRVQPDATAWKLGTFIHIPVLPDCGEGESRTGRLRVRYPSGTGSTAELVLVFTFDCLDELRFTFGEPPDPIPAGSLWEILGEKRRLSLLPDAYRFSEIDVGSNAELRVRPDQAVFTGPLTLEVTSDVRVNSGAAIATDFLGGAVDTGFLSDPCPWWTSPIPGILERGPQCGLGAGHFGFFEGPGGVGGKWHGGRGGEGGAYDGRSDRGESGQHAAFGGSGGEGGEPWEFQSPLNVVASAFDLVTSALQGDFVGVALAAYDLTSTSVKVLHNDENKITGTGRGGQAARRRQNGLTDPPQAGGGGGGGGKTYIDCSFLFIDFCSDENGSGGGGGGGGAHPLNLRAGGDVVVEVNGAITGIGGPGGLGGGGFFETSGGGGGGAGGNGAYIRITANELFNLGKLSTAGGIPGLSQYCPGQNLGNIDGEYCIFSDVFLIDTGIGERGRDGAFSVRAGFRGQLPIDSNFSIAGPTDPWAQEHEFLFPGLGDTDGDGLKDGLEDHIGTDKTSADPDLDGLTDFEEVLETGTDPNLRDTDGDGLSDGDELSANPFVTDPLLADTDGDGFEDGFEIDKGSSPVDENSTPEICDGSDNDLDGQTDEDCELRLDHKGREFFVPFLPTLDTDGLDPTLKLLITSEGFADVTVEYPVGNVIDTVAVTPDAPGEVTVPVTASTDWVPGTRALP